MDIRNIFKEISEQLLSEFRKTAEVNHSGGKGDLREDAFRDFLHDYLPKKYATGQGEIITPENRMSGQLDIIIYDPMHCPRLIKSNSHSVYPIESIYGAISIKSHLDSAELKDAYDNIASLKKILIKQSFTSHPISAMAVGMGFTVPVTGIVAYDAKRSLESISAQAKTLDVKLSDITLRPDFIAVIGKGIIAPRELLRGTFNSYKLPDDKDKLVELRKTGRHTLLRLYMQILTELNTLNLRPLDLHDYDKMPKLIGPYRVRRHDQFIKSPISGNPTESKETKTLQLNKTGIDEIVNKSKPVTVRQHYMNYVGQVPPMAEKMHNLHEIIYEYNPKNLPPISSANIIRENGRVYPEAPVFYPFGIEIDGKHYAVDMGTLLEEHFENNYDLTVDELTSM